MTHQLRTLAVPLAPATPTKSPFPVLATVAPVVAALALWGFTHSPFALVFALLGPIIAVASLGDSRRRTKSDARAEHNRFERDLVAAIHAVDEEHERERRDLDRRYPTVSHILTAPMRNPERWRARRGDSLPIRLGTGAIDSALQLQGEPDRYATDDTALALARLRDRARELTAAPVVVDATLGIGVCGADAQTLALANAIVVQLAQTLSPSEFAITRVATRHFGWLSRLPHECVHSRPNTPPVAGSVGSDRVEFHSKGDSASVVVAIAGNEQSLPPECRIVVQLVGSVAQLVREPNPSMTRAFAPELAGDRQSRVFAEVLATAAVDLPRPPGHTLARDVALSSVQQPPHSSGRSLAACIGVSENGDVALDLVADGPHAIVGGTTGSGKSELLLTWILAMATNHDPSQVNFLLVDFKGGASFSAVADLPHAVGVLTDLNEAMARRAILSLRAELGRRETILAEVNARSIEELGDSVRLSRLVIVVDEFATLTTQLPELHELFADLAARGRSLGIHLILCTQRPAATVRDSVLANCSLRISLRVTNSEDSVAVIGAPDAARLPRDIAGRAIIARGDGQPQMVQLAHASVELAARIEPRVRGDGDDAPPPFRPWLDPLPAVLSPGVVPAASAPAIAFGLLDLPEEQRQDPALFDPVAQGNLLVLGGHRSGKSTALAALSAGAVEVVAVPGSVEKAWDSVERMVNARREPRSPTLLLIDDIDELVGRIPADHAAEFVERLCLLAREGPRVGLSLVLSASHIRGRLHSLTELCETKLYLRMPSKQDFVLAGGIPGDYVTPLPPGGGIWNGHRVQIVSADVADASQSQTCPAEELSLSPGVPIAVISSRPAAIRAQLEQLGAVTTLNAVVNAANHVTVESATPILLGDPDAWQSSWSLLTAVKVSGSIAFHDCAVADFRALTRRRQLPLPVDSADTLVVVDPDGRMRRAALPPRVSDSQ